MLSVPAPFPFPGAPAYMRGGTPCRILQRRRDGRLLVSLTGVSNAHPDIATCASGNRTVDLAEIFETEAEAMGIARPASRRTSRTRKGTRR